MIWEGERERREKYSVICNKIITTNYIILWLSKIYYQNYDLQGQTKSSNCMNARKLLTMQCAHHWIFSGCVSTTRINLEAEESSNWPDIIEGRERERKRQWNRIWRENKEESNKILGIENRGQKRIKNNICFSSVILNLWNFSIFQYVFPRIFIDRELWYLSSQDDVVFICTVYVFITVYGICR